MKHLLTILFLLPALAWGQSGITVKTNPRNPLDVETVYSGMLARFSEPFESKLEREGMPIYQAYNNTNLTSTAPAPVTVANNQTYFSFTPQVGTKVWIEELQITVPEALTIAVQWQNSPIAVSGFGGNYVARRVLPGVENRIPIRRFVPNNVTLSVTQVGNYTLTAGPGTVQIGFTAGIRTSMDFGRNAERVILKLHDSILDGSGPSSWDDYFDVKLRNRLAKATGKTWEIVSKGKGGFTSASIDALRAQGQLNVTQADIILYEPMMNDTDTAAYSANLSRIITWKQTYFPKAFMFVIGITPRSDAQEATLAQLRTIAQNKVAAARAAGDDRIISVNMGDLWASNATPSLYWSDGSSPYVHPNAAGHALGDARLWQSVSPIVSQLP
ncbi:SGNH/GDSL hydrolase family protein [Fibrisoma montanum]|uniref:SGNH/GDSL hydrolase family protein n=1 Tax=Fibrisoma montanum TaxID=2305895 RepID=A0A418M3J6_9BACT|nr:SGNH/GDSL hydrolase family protein [Fibrisoma montanum]RIV20342.1 SGNH/GDSL hydrolase family protein [Fibrisoma montanum]